MEQTLKIELQTSAHMTILLWGIGQGEFERDTQFFLITYVVTVDKFYSSFRFLIRPNTLAVRFLFSDRNSKYSLSCLQLQEANEVS